MTENVPAWEMWMRYFEGLITLNVHMSGVIYTLSLDFLKFLFDNHDLGDRIVFYQKIKTVFDVWRELTERKENPKTNAAMKRVKEMQRVG